MKNPGEPEMVYHLSGRHGRLAMNEARRGRWTVGLVVCVLALVLGAEALGQPRGKRADAIEELLFDLYLVPLEGRAPPALGLKALDGRTVSLAELRGRPVLLYFWTTW